MVETADVGNTVTIVAVPGEEMLSPQATSSTKTISSKVVGDFKKSREEVTAY
jgi:hypothetical protein